MEFYETVMGKRFYTSDFPKLVRELEKMNESMSDIAGRMRAADEQRDDRKPETKPSGAKPAYDGKAVERAIGLLREGGGADLRSVIAEEAASYTYGDPLSLISNYKRASEEQRRVIDMVLMDLTGWRMSTLCRLLIRRAEKDIDRAAWKTADGFISIQLSSDGDWDYTLYSTDYKLIDGGRIDVTDLSISEVRDQILEDFEWDTSVLKSVDYDDLEELVS